MLNIEILKLENALYLNLKSSIDMQFYKKFVYNFAVGKIVNFNF